MTTGEKIKMLRVKKGMSQEELGKKVGVQKAAINKYEKGIVVNLKMSTFEFCCLHQTAAQQRHTKSPRKR